MKRLICLSIAALALLQSGMANLSVGPVPAQVREQFALAPFYQKHLDVGGLPIVGSAKVSDAALAECGWIVQQMLVKRPDILAALGNNGVRFAVMAHNEYTTDVPEHSKLTPRVYWDRRARGLGATPHAPAVSAAEENLLAYPGDPYPREIIAIHEFAHAIHEMGLNTVDPTFDKRLAETYEKAMAAGLWKSTYAAVNRQEYWAEAVQAWFDNNAANDALHNDANTREKLKAYDPAVAALCEEVFGDIPWRYTKPATRPAAECAHLKDLPANPPRFQWREEPVPDRPRIRLQCAVGDLELEFQTAAAKDAVTMLLVQVHEGYFSGGRATFAEETLQLAPSEKLPDGSAVPAGTSPWRLVLRGEAEAPALRAEIRKGGALIPKLIELCDTEGGIAVQRIVRLN